MFYRWTQYISVSDPRCLSAVVHRSVSRSWAMAAVRTPPPTNAGTAQSRRHDACDVNTWRQRVKEWYPRWRERTYMVPRVQMNHTHYTETKLSGIPVQIPQPPKTPQKGQGAKVLLESDVICDKANQRLRHCLYHLLEAQKKEVMFVVYDLRFENYLKTARTSLPRSVDPILSNKNKSRGDFDVLMLHRFYGVLACEVKSVGASPHFQTLQEPERLRTLEKKVQESIKQLDKAEEVLSHLVSDMTNQPRIGKALILTHISASQLSLLLGNRPQLRGDLGKCLGIPGTEDPVSFCVTSDQLSDPASPYDVTDDVIQRLEQWWQTRVTAEGSDPAMSEDLYLELLARFVGPATEVKVFCSTVPPLSVDAARSQGEAASETGARFTRLVLTPAQLDIHRRSEPRVIITGPPGVGKSVMLLLQALKWLEEGKHVDVLSTWKVSLASSLSLRHSLAQHAREMHGVTAQQVHLHEFNLREPQERERAVRVLETCAARSRGGSGGGGGELYLIVDEMCYDDDGKAQPFDSMLQELLQRGSVRAEQLHMWLALMRDGRTPAVYTGGSSTKLSLTEVALDIPLRTPPSVTREVQKSTRAGRQQKAYAADYVHQHTDGPPVLYLDHADLGHDLDLPPLRCQPCGSAVARMLIEDFHVGQRVEGRPASASQLQYRDVFVLTGRPVIDQDALVTGLQKEGLPVSVLRSRDSEAAARVVSMATDEVVVADYRAVHGLEKKVVVWVQNYVTSRDAQHQSPDEQYGRMNAMSRCCGQLVCVVPSSATIT